MSSALHLQTFHFQFFPFIFTGLVCNGKMKRQQIILFVLFDPSTIEDYCIFDLALLVGLSVLEHPQTNFCWERPDCVLCLLYRLLRIVVQFQDSTGVVSTLSLLFLGGPRPSYTAVGGRTIW